MKKYYIKIIVILLMLNLIFLNSCKLNSKNTNKDEIFSEDRLYKVEETQISNYIVAKGTMQSREEMLVTHSPIASIDILHVKKGDYVKKGDLLFSYKKSDIQQKIDEITKEYEELKMKEEYISSKNQRNYQEAVEEKERKVNDAQNNIDDAENTYEKILNEYYDVQNECLDIENKMKDAQNEPDLLAIYSDKYSQKISEINVLEQSVLESKKILEEAKSQYDSVVFEEQKNVESMLDIINDEKYSSDLLNIEKQIEDKKETLENADVYAPVNGIILDIYIEQGLNPIDEKTILISNCDKMSVVLNVNEEDIQSVKKDMTVDIYIGKKNDKIEGKVARISYINSETTSTYSVEVNIENKVGDKFFLGMSVTANIYIDVKENAISIPYECINIDENDKIYVNKYMKDNKSIEKVFVETGIEAIDSVEIISDYIKEGDNLIINK